MTIQPPTQGVRRITIRNAAVKVPSEVRSSRGVLFRSAYEILGARRGSAWIAQASQKFPALAEALAPDSSPLAWHPTSAFIQVLRSLWSDHSDGTRLAQQLGRTAASSSFGQFYGADPSSATPAQVLRSAEVFWRCYHSWGAIDVVARGTEAEVIVADGVRDQLLCASTAGLLAGVVAFAGGRSVVVKHPRCVAFDENAKHCAFHVSWAATT